MDEMERLSLILSCAKRWLLDIPEGIQVCIAGFVFEGNQIIQRGAVMTLPKSDGESDMVITDCDFVRNNLLVVGELLVEIALEALEPEA